MAAGEKRYLAFLGRIAREKRVDRAVEIAIKAGMPLKIAAKVDPSDREYYEREIKPLLHHPLIEYIGEISEEQKPAFLGAAYAQIFPIDWPEPFGLVMIESMACGTPVVAFRNGSVPEIVEDGITGWIVDSEEQAVRSLQGLEGFDRHACRARFEERFSARRMAADYAHVYRRILARSASTIPLRASA